MRGLLSDAVRNLRHAGLDAVKEVAWRTYLSVGSPTAPDPVLEADWDLLIVLDACRADLFEAVVSEGDSDFQAGVTRVSPASSSPEWLEAVFGAAPRAALSGLGYVTGNPYTDAHLSPSAFGLLDEVWRYAWDDDLGTIPPGPITDRAIVAGRERDLDRLVVHYMQPHFPPLPATATGTSASNSDSNSSSDSNPKPASNTGVDARAGNDGGERGGRHMAAQEWGDRPLSVWEELRFGRPVESAWAEYRANLECVLADVEVLLSNVDAERAVVTADHGNAFGERYIYGHPGGVDLPCLREVPWCVTAATDGATREPEEYDPDRRGPAGVDERLAELGYRT
jgi:hypothetical protein